MDWVNERKDDINIIIQTVIIATNTRKTNALALASSSIMRKIRSGDRNVKMGLVCGHDGNAVSERSQSFVYSKLSPLKLKWEIRRETMERRQIECTGGETFHFQTRSKPTA